MTSLTMMRVINVDTNTIDSDTNDINNDTDTFDNDTNTIYDDTVKLFFLPLSVPINVNSYMD